LRRVEKLRFPINSLFETNDLIYEGIATLTLRTISLCPASETNDLIYEGIATLKKALIPYRSDNETNDLIYEGIATEPDTHR